jgi:ABC-type Fe3+-siderophore transport system permease subunit
LPAPAAAPSALIISFLLNLANIAARFRAGSPAGAFPAFAGTPFMMKSLVRPPFVD